MVEFHNPSEQQDEWIVGAFGLRGNNLGLPGSCFNGFEGDSIQGRYAINQSEIEKCVKLKESFYYSVVHSFYLFENGISLLTCDQSLSVYSVRV